MARAKTEPPPRVNIEPDTIVRVVGGPFNGRIGRFVEQKPSGYCYVSLQERNKAGDRILVLSLVPSCVAAKERAA